MKSDLINDYLILFIAKGEHRHICYIPGVDRWTRERLWICSVLGLAPELDYLAFQPHLDIISSGDHERSRRRILPSSAAASARTSQCCLSLPVLTRPCKAEAMRRLQIRHSRSIPQVSLARCLRLIFSIRHSTIVYSQYCA